MPRTIDLTALRARQEKERKEAERMEAILDVLGGRRPVDPARLRKKPGYTDYHSTQFVVDETAGKMVIKKRADLGKVMTAIKSRGDHIPRRSKDMKLVATLPSIILLKIAQDYGVQYMGGADFYGAVNKALKSGDYDDFKVHANA